MKQIKKIDKDIFYLLENYLIKTKNDSDKSNFQEIKNRLNNQYILNCNDFAKEVIYVIMTAGFRQDTAKKFYLKIVDYLNNNKIVNYNDLINIFKNEKKIKSIIKVWNDKINIQRDFYKLKTDDEKINFLSKLPYVGSITKYHFARNLGINCYKPDRWITKIYCVLSNDSRKYDKIYKLFMKKNNSVIYNECLKFFEKEFEEILKIEKIGYVDVVLFKSCQQKLLVLDEENNKIFLNVI